MSMRTENVTGWKVRPMMRSLAVVGTLICLASARPVQASYEIGAFSQPVGSSSATPGITWTNSGNTSGTLTGTETGVFSFVNMGALLTDPSLNGAVVPATMTITASTVTDGFTANGQVNQPLSGSVTITINPLSNPSENLLTATVTSGTTLLTGKGSSGAVLASQPGDNVTFTSNVFNPALLNSQAFTAALSGITPPLSFNTTGGHSILNDFSAFGSVLFSANAVSVPEPASVALLGLGCVVLVGVRRRSRRIAA